MSSVSFLVPGQIQPRQLETGMDLDHLKTLDSSLLAFSTEIDEAIVKTPLLYLKRAIIYFALKLYRNALYDTDKAVNLCQGSFVGYEKVWGWVGGLALQQLGLYAEARDTYHAGYILATTSNLQATFRKCHAEVCLLLEQSEAVVVNKSMGDQTVMLNMDTLNVDRLIPSVNFNEISIVKTIEKSHVASTSEPSICADLSIINITEIPDSLKVQTSQNGLDHNTVIR